MNYFSEHLMCTGFTVMGTPLDATMEKLFKANVPLGNLLIVGETLIVAFTVVEPNKKSVLKIYLFCDNELFVFQN